MLACAMLACSLFGIEEVEQEAVAPTVTQTVEEAPEQSEPTVTQESETIQVEETLTFALVDEECPMHRQASFFAHFIPDSQERIDLVCLDQEEALLKFQDGELAMIEYDGRSSLELDLDYSMLLIEDSQFLVHPQAREEIKALAPDLAQNWRAVVEIKEIPLTYEETPFTFTNPTVLETYQQGDYDPASEEQLETPTFEDIDFYVETGRIVLVEIQASDEAQGQDSDEVQAGADVYDQWVSHSGKWVINSLNALPNADGDHYLGLRNVETGEKEVILMTPEEPAVEVDFAAYTPNEPYCYPTTDYVAINLDVPPFDQLEVRQALAAATDQEAYHGAWGWGDSQVAYSFIPSNSWGIGWGDEGYFSTLGDGFFLELEVDLGGWPDACAYCGECVDNDKMAADLIEMWESELGISIGTTSISHDQLSAPIVGQDYGMLFRAWTGSSWLDYTKTVIEEGHLMVPEGEYDRFMQLVYDAAMESDPQKQGEMIAELDRLLVQEWAIVIPLLTYEWCPDAPVTRADWDS